MADHFNLCYNRLKYLQRRLIKHPNILQKYQCTISEQLRCGIIEPVQDNEQSSGGFVHYMPHHPVVKQDRSTTKVCIVYDGSATSQDCSVALNDCLQVGPNLIPRLFDVLIRFRCYQVALTGDIEKAFLMIGIRESDRDMLCFVWLQDPFQETSKLLHFRFTRLVFGLRPSPAILGSVISYHLEKYCSEHPWLVDKVEQSLYVDDLVSGGATVQEAFEVYKSSKWILQSGTLILPP